MSPLGQQTAGPGAKSNVERPPQPRRSYAPIAFFAYKRPRHTLAALSALKANTLSDCSTLYIYCDGPKSRDDLPAVTAVREVVRSETWCQTVHIVERERNLGLANSVIAGVTELTDRYGAAIVLEDDLVTSTGFLRFANEALHRYWNEPSVMQVSAYIAPVSVAPGPDAVFLPFTASWGWATWERAWRHFDGRMSVCRKVLRTRAERWRFDLEGTYPFSRLALQQQQGKIDSWAICWYLSTFIRNGLTLYPSRSLVQNTGFDGSGVHCKRGSDFDVSLTEFSVNQWPEHLAVSDEVYQAIVKYYRARRMCKASLHQQLLHFGLDRLNTLATMAGSFFRVQ